MSTYLTREITKAGAIYFVRTFVPRKRAPEIARSPRRTVTPETMRAANDRAAERRLQMEINSNFDPDDWYVTLTYRMLPEAAGALKDVRKFIRQIGTLYGRLELPFKYVYTIEYHEQRINHHLIISGGVAREEIKRFWQHGFMKIEHLYSDGDYRTLASYLIKESSKYFRQPDAIMKRRYGRSRNLIKPETRREDVKPTEFLCPTPPAGYYIDKDSFFDGVNPVTGDVYNEYVLLPIETNAKYKKWARLKKTRPRTLGHTSWLRDNEEYQIELPLTE